MSKTSTAVKRRYNEKTFARLYITIPIDQKDSVMEYAEAQGTNVNNLINEYLRNALELTESQWRGRDE